MIGLSRLQGVDVDHNNLNEENGESAHKRRGRPRTATAEERRKEILEIAQTAFLEHGYGGTTMDMIAAEAKVSKRTLYELFPGKSALFLAIFVAQRKRMLHLPRPDEDDIAAALEDIFRIDISEEEDDARAVFFQFVALEADRFPELIDILRRHGVEEARRLLAEWLDRQRERGLIVTDDTMSDARMLMDMIFGSMGMKYKSCGDWPSLDERRVHMRRCIQIFLNGVRQRD